MEALTAASVACLTIYDMAKAVDRGMVISGIRLIEKTGGKSGDFRAGEEIVDGACFRSRKRWPGCSRTQRRSARDRARSREAGGRVLAEPMKALRTQPPFPASAMDGYAVRAADLSPGATARGHRRSAGRRAVRRLRSGRARPCASSPARRCRTAPTRSSSRKMPTASTTSTVEVLETVAAGRHIRRAGLDFAEGEALLEPVRVLDAAALSLAAAANHAALPVLKRPLVADHRHRRRAAAAGQHPRARPDHRVEQLWRRRDRARQPAPTSSISASCADRPTRSARRVGKRARRAGADIIVTLGGASVGDHDLVNEVLTAEGMALDFWKIAMRPGKPLMFGRLGATRVSACPAIRSRASSARISS